MTVQELIIILEQVEDKSLIVVYSLQPFGDSEIDMVSERWVEGENSVLGEYRVISLDEV